MERWLKRVLLGGLAVAAVYVALGIVADVGALRAALARLEGRAVVLAVALVLAAYTLRAMRWRLYLHRLGVIEPVGREALGFAAGFTMGMAPGKSGQAVKAYYLQLATGIGYSVSVPATVAERVSDTLSVALLLVVGLALSPAADWRLAPVAAAALALLVVALRSGGLARGALLRLRRIRRLARHESTLLAAHGRLREQLTFRQLAAPTVIGLSGFLFEALALSVLAERGLGLALPFGDAALILALADLAGVMSLIPAGLGATEGSLVVLLAARGASLAEATALTLVFRACTLWLGLSLGALAALALQTMHLRRRRARPEPPRA